MDCCCIVYQWFSLIFPSGDHNRNYFAHASTRLVFYWRNLTWFIRYWTFGGDCPYSCKRSLLYSRKAIFIGLTLRYEKCATHLNIKGICCTVASQHLYRLDLIVVGSITYSEIHCKRLSETYYNVYCTCIVLVLLEMVNFVAFSKVLRLLERQIWSLFVLAKINTLLACFQMIAKTIR